MNGWVGGWMDGWMDDFSLKSLHGISFFIIKYCCLLQVMR